MSSPTRMCRVCKDVFPLAMFPLNGRGIRGRACAACKRRHRKPPSKSVGIQRPLGRV